MKRPNAKQSKKATALAHAEDERRLDALRKAIAVGVADIEAGRFRTFDSTESLPQYFSELAEEAIAGRKPGA